MKASRREFDDLIAEFNTNKAPPAQEILAKQAQVDKKLLTNDPHWDIFLQEIQALIDATLPNIEAYQAAIESPTLSDPIELNRIRSLLFIANERVGTLKMVMDIPNRIINE